MGISSSSPGACKHKGTKKGACLAAGNGNISRNGGGEDDSVGYEQQDHAAVFDLSMDYSDDEVLLDWEQYSGARA